MVRSDHLTQFDAKLKILKISDLFKYELPKCLSAVPSKSSASFIQLFYKMQTNFPKINTASDPNNNLTLNIFLYRTSKLQRGIKYYLKKFGTKYPLT